MCACLNDLTVNSLLSTEAITQASSTLERTRAYFGIFKKALRAEDDLKTATVARDTFHPKVEVLRAKNEALADLDHQIAELQH
ncbi:hypothetical protein ACFX1R_023844 [Malus domestica]